MPDLDVVEKAFRQAELVIVQDAYHPTETTRFADVLLPAAQWPEKDGVMTNSERRLTYLPKLVEPPGEALPDAVIIARWPRELGWGAAFPSGRRRHLRRVRRADRGHAVRLLGREPCAAPRGRAAAVAVPAPTIPGPSASTPMAAFHARRPRALHRRRARAPVEPPDADFP